MLFICTCRDILAKVLLYSKINRVQIVIRSDLITIVISVFVRNTSRTYKPSVDSIVLAKNRIISGVPSVGTTQLDCGEPRSFFLQRGVADPLFKFL